MFFVLLGLAASVYEIYNLATNYQGFVQRDWLQHGGILAVGVYLFVVNGGLKYLGSIPASLSKLKGLANKPTNNTNTVVTPTIENENMEKKIYQPQDYELKDYECLVHLRNRVIELGDAEGLEACNKLNQVMFNLAAKERVKAKENEATK